MADAKHTPGPWSYGYYGCSGYCVNGGGQHIATSILYKRDGGEANARLIAAAPEMLAALQALLDFHTRPAGFDTAVLMDNEQFGEFLAGINTNSDEVTAQARAAIAKATGEQQ
jgi:hypothetical protein